MSPAPPAPGRGRGDVKLGDTWAMTLWRVRDFHEDDLDSSISMWDDPTSGGKHPVFGLSELITAVREGGPAVVATVDDELVGTAVARVSGDRAWILRITLAPAWRRRGIGSSMLLELERRLVASGVHRVASLLPEDEELGAVALMNSGYTMRRSVAMYEKLEPLAPADFGILERLGGRLLRPDLWEQLAGMASEKDTIEQRLILPLAHTSLADRVGLPPPRAVVLFGPPGTGKTTLAKGIASRLSWPFVELFPSRLAGESPAGLAAALREAFAMVAELDNLVLFIDEVEELAGMREHRTASVAQGVTNEMLKLIPAFREREGRLLVCATNSIRALDTAFLRHGRFDYLIPIGPPDAAARSGIWNRYLQPMPLADVDLTQVVAASELFTPADIEFAARKTAQYVFERALRDGHDQRVSTVDVLRGIGETRRTLTAEIVAEFEEDITRHARV